MRRIFIFLLLVNTLSGMGQITLSGKITNKQGIPLPYASLIITNSKTSTISDHQGMYTLAIADEFVNHSLIVSAFGYHDKELNMNDLKENNIDDIVLEEDPTENYNLSEVVITAKQWKNKVIGKKKRPMLTHAIFFNDNAPTIEQGSIFKVDTRTKLNQYNFHIIPSAKFKQITLKLNIYQVKDNQIDRPLLAENIIYTTSTTGWQTVDLKDAKILIKDQNEIAITLQLVDYDKLPEEEFNFGLSYVMSPSKNLLFRYQNRSPWEFNSGNFLANIHVNYEKNNASRVNKSDEEEMDDEEPEEITSLGLRQILGAYKAEKGKKASRFGKNKEGQFISIANAKMYYEVYGQGEPVILLHGNGGSIVEFYQQIPTLAKHFQVIAVDTRGQGKSTDLSSEAYTYDLFASDIGSLMDHLSIKKAHIVGWSDGGNTGLSLAIHHPEKVNKLVLIGANLFPEGVEQKVLANFKEQIEFNKEHDNRLFQLLLDEPHFTTEQLKAIQSKTLVLAGEFDVILPAHTDLIRQSIPEATMQIIPKTTHYLLQEAPEEVNPIVLEFLQKMK